MPNLIIKPQTGSGNSVILQDQGGAAILTTADSGGANVNIGSSSTFPAGHVINHWQIVRSSGGAERQQTVDSTPTIVDLNGALTITGVTATENNYFRITWGGMSWRINNDGTYTSHFQIYDGSAILADYEFYYDMPGSADYFNGPITLMNMVTVPASFTSKDVSLRVWEMSGNTASVNRLQAGDTGVTTAPFLTIDEIQA